MPTMKEIAEALEKAATIIECRSTTKDGNDFVALFESLASQVEQMQCETCSDRFKITGNDLEGIPCPWIGCGGCIHHKFKEVENG